MTQNQIAYQQLSEQSRHNRVSEILDGVKGVLGAATSIFKPIKVGANVAKTIAANSVSKKG